MTPAHAFKVFIHILVYFMLLILSCWWLCSGNIQLSGTWRKYFLNLDQETATIKHVLILFIFKIEFFYFFNVNRKTIFNDTKTVKYTCLQSKTSNNDWSLMISTSFSVCQYSSLTPADTFSLSSSTLQSHCPQWASLQSSVDQ